MKNGLRFIVGKRIAGVAVAESNRPPRQQVFLLFADGTCFELYGESFTCCSGLDDASHVEGYVESNHGRVVAVYGNAPPGSPSAAKHAPRIKDARRRRSRPG